jgi:hypothetical protein
MAVTPQDEAEYRAMLPARMAKATDELNEAIPLPDGMRFAWSTEDLDAAIASAGQHVLHGMSHTGALALAADEMRNPPPGS